MSTFGPHIDSIITLIFYIVGTFFILAEGALLAFILIYRRRPGERAAFIRGESMRELAWVLIPVLIVTILDVAIDVAAAPVWDLVKEQNPPATVTVEVLGYQFGWVFLYAGPDGKFGTRDGFAVTNTLTLPAGQVVRLLAESDDVIHSFYVPELRLKQDLLPERQIPVWFEVTRPGKYEIACSQLCGVSHFAMKGILRVVTPAEYQQWYEQERAKARPGRSTSAGAISSARGKQG